MRLSTVVPHPELRPFIHHFWVFESDQGLPDGDARVVVPNGRHKLIVPYHNALLTIPGRRSGAWCPHTRLRKRRTTWTIC